MMAWNEYKQQDVRKEMEWIIKELNRFKIERKDYILDNLIGVLQFEIKEITLIKYKLWFYEAKTDKWFGAVSSTDKESLEDHTLKHFGKDYDKYVIVPENVELSNGINNEVMEFMLNIYRQIEKEELVIKDV